MVPFITEGVEFNPRGERLMIDRLNKQCMIAHGYEISHSEMYTPFYGVDGAEVFQVGSAR